MNDLIQPSLFDAEHPVKSIPRTVVYEPPTIQDVDRYAHAVCRELAQQTNASTPDTEMMRGFAAFIRAVVNITVHSLNNKSKKMDQENGDEHAA